MKHVHDTWYVLEDGRKVDPDDVAADDKGVLRHRDGAAVAMRGSVPHTSGAGPAAPSSKDRELKAAEPAKGYRTRGAKESE